MIIIKFGGTSVSTKKNIDSILKIVKRNLRNNPIVVVSALSGVTDLLLSLIYSPKPEQIGTLNEIRKKHFDLVFDCLGKLPLEIKMNIDQSIEDLTKLLDRNTQEKSFRDEVISYGEIMSSYIITQLLNFSKIESKQIIASKIIITDSHFGGAEFLPELTKTKTKKVLLPYIKKGIVPIITGFIGSTKKGQITTLGRGGSDYSAAIIGYALEVKEIQIWTDVDGVFSSDPKFIKDAKILKEISYKEASELAAFGAKVLHPRTIRPAISADIPVKVLNTLNPNASGTIIKAKSQKSNNIIAIAAKRNITLVNLYSTDMLLSKGFLARIFTIFAKYDISIDLVSVSEVSVSVSLDNDEYLDKAVNELKDLASITVTRELGMVSLIGEGIVEVKSILRNIFLILDNARINVRMISLGATDINISLVLASESIDKTVRLFHKELISERKNL
ncbi:MAG: aspartate kinase [Candidatus Levybacteria bacterium]|nr:aspartate kinase [Candidatus Levybacteria bacterium]